MKNQNIIEIYPLDLLYYIGKRLWILGLVCLLFVAGAFLKCRFFEVPAYTASTRIYVLSRSSDAAVSYSDFQTSTQLLNDYEVLITGRNVTSAVIERLELRLTDEELAKEITISSPGDTRFLQIDVTDPDPERAAQIADCVREVSSEQLVSIMAIDAVNTVYEANVPDAPTTPKTRRTVLYAAMIGAALALIVLFIGYILDDTLRTEEDVERYLGLSTIGVIPVSQEINRSDDFQLKGAKGLAGRLWK